MAVTSPTRLGQVNTTGDSEALFLKVAAGEVLTMFERENVTLSRIFTRVMPRGAKSLQFPGIGRAVTARHEVGKDILEDTRAAGNDTPTSGSSATNLLTTVNLGEREVFIDDPLHSSAFVDDWEEFKSSFDAMSPIAEELGTALAEDSDIYAFLMMLKGARDTAANGGIDWTNSNIPDEHKPATDGENDFIDANAGTDGSVLLDLLRQVSERFDDPSENATPGGDGDGARPMPSSDRFVALRPTHYNLLVQNQDLLNRDFGGQNGIFSDGTVFKAWGMTLLKSTNVPTTDFSSFGTVGVRGTDYNVNALGTIAVCWHRRAIGAVRAGAVSMARQFFLNYGGTLLQAKIGTGYECLRPQGVARIGTS